MHSKETNHTTIKIGKIASETGKGLIAGAAGTLAITLSQMIEMKITKRKPSQAPAEAAEKVLDIRPKTKKEKEKLSQEVHWAYGTVWGLSRSVMSLLGLRGLSATALQFGTIYSTALILPSSLHVAPPLKKWSAKDMMIDALHHAVYAVTAGVVFDTLHNDSGKK